MEFVYLLPNPLFVYLLPNPFAVICNSWVIEILIAFVSANNAIRIVL